MSRPFPNESPDYRAAREALLDAEAALRAQAEAVAVLRRQLPLGGRIPKDYVFVELTDGARHETPLSALFAPGHDTLFVYNFMYGEHMERACSSCTSVLDALDATAHHATQRISLAVVATSPIERIQAFAAKRGWRNLRLLSSGGNTFEVDYNARGQRGGPLPMGHVFKRTPEGIHHFWSTELLFRGWDGGDPRHVDTLWPLWNLFDLTPDGRGGDWYPALDYDAPGCHG